MGAPRFQAVALPKTGHADTDRALAELSRLLNVALDGPLARSRVMTVTLAAGVNRISHGLGRVPTGFFATPHSYDTAGAEAAYETSVAVSSHTATMTTAGRVVLVEATTASSAGVKTIQSTAAPAAGAVYVAYSDGVGVLTFNAADAVTACTVLIDPPQALTTHIVDGRTANPHTSTLLYVHSATATDATLVVF